MSVQCKCTARVRNNSNVITHYHLIDDSGNKVASVGTVNTNTGVNGMATATSTKDGKTTFEATVPMALLSKKKLLFSNS